jgi:hypothetical protein
MFLIGTSQVPKMEGETNVKLPLTGGNFISKTDTKTLHNGK